jgi:peptide deformylase
VGSKERSIVIPAIRTFSDPILKEVCKAIQGDEDIGWLRDLEAACFANDGAGLAAPQIGVAKRAIFMTYGRNHGILMVNPELSEHSEEMVTAEERCLSYPGMAADIARHKSVRCTWALVLVYPTLRLDNRKMSRIFNDWEARVLQHEVDHLDGICRVGMPLQPKENESDDPT